MIGYQHPHHHNQSLILNHRGAKYKDMKRITHSFRRRGLLAEDRETRPVNPATLDEAWHCGSGARARDFCRVSDVAKGELLRQKAYWNENYPPGN